MTLEQLHDIVNYELFSIGNTKVTTVTVVVAFVVAVATVATSRVIQRAMRRAATARGVGEEDGSVAVAQRLVHYAVLLIGSFVGLQGLGIDLSALVAAGAVFAVGVGLAIQNLAQNFVSGVILLLERSIKPGDVVEVDGRTVRVRSMGIRSTICRSRDGEDIIVPNSMLVQGLVKNLTLGDDVIRVRVPVGVHYDSDLRVVQEALLAAAEAAPGRIADREPILLLLGFGSSSVDFEVSIWATDPWRLPRIQTDLALAVWEHLHARGVVIAFPQVDVHFDPKVTDGLRVMGGGRG
ncbi:MAG: mechanosensitive ion channel [Alphaproteobacteria bacterium]|nr:mechanosensitive ion channel [Alphaproteobacteria bacterium]MCB9698384.1 mechanosensitive ion channel [Alphaproteobacteria bacterium]